MKHTIAGLVMALGVLLCSGCATVVKHDIPVTDLEPVSLPLQAKGDLTYSVDVHNLMPGTASVSMHGVSMSGSEWTTTESDVSRGLRQHFLDSGYFNSVREVREPGDFHLQFDVTMNPSANENTSSFLAGFTLFLIPVWYSHDAELVATLYEHGVKKDSFFAREAVTRIWWLPLLPVGLFKNIPSAGKEIRKNYVNSLILELQGKGYLPIKKAEVLGAAVVVP